jgi:hypothetical protein
MLPEVVCRGNLGGAMKEHRVKVVVLENGRVVVEGVPVRVGQEVDVTIHIEEPVRPTFPLRGLPVRYDDPFLPAVTESEWDAGK